LGGRGVVIVVLTARDIQIQNFLRWCGGLHMAACRPFCTWRHQSEEVSWRLLGLKAHIYTNSRQWESLT
jgi:hypothetical protein